MICRLRSHSWLCIPGLLFLVIQYKLVFSGKEEVETAIHKMKKGVGDDWRGGSQVGRKATERVYVGGKDTERVEDGPDSADMEEERECA